ncbi:MAG: XRE family transcriptional regulator, partial [Elusimicrobiota bacterium]
MNPNYNFSILRQLRKRAEITIDDLAEKSGISFAVISKLERNIGNPELRTIAKVARALEISATDFISMAETIPPKRVKFRKYKSGDFYFCNAEFNNAKVLFGSAKKGGCVKKPEKHEDEFEVCMALEGKIKITMLDHFYVLNKGESIQFNALFEHEYKALEDCKVVIVHVRKEKSF